MGQGNEFLRQMRRIHGNGREEATPLQVENQIKGGNDDSDGILYDSELEDLVLEQKRRCDERSRKKTGKNGKRRR